MDVYTEALENGKLFKPNSLIMAGQLNVILDILKSILIEKGIINEDEFQEFYIAALLTSKIENPEDWGLR